MTPEERLFIRLTEAANQRASDIYALRAVYEAGLSDEAGYKAALDGVEKVYNWNLGQAQMDFDLDIGYTRLPVGLEREA